MLQTSQSLWEKTNVQNLFRYRPSGTYFARFKIGDKPIRQSLETTVFSVAKQRLPEKMREYRSRHESARAFADGKMTVGDAAEVYLRKVRASASLKPRSKNYREMILGFIKRSWPALLETDVRKVNERDCENWFARYHPHPEHGRTHIQQFDISHILPFKNADIKVGWDFQFVRIARL